MPSGKGSTACRPPPGSRSSCAQAGSLWRARASTPGARRGGAQRESHDARQKQSGTAKAQVIHLADVPYTGSKAQADGTSLQFYLIGIRQQTRSDLDYQSYMFTLDRDGKIAKVQ